MAQGQFPASDSEKEITQNSLTQLTSIMATNIFTRYSGPPPANTLPQDPQGKQAAHLQILRQQHQDVKTNIVNTIVREKERLIRRAREDIELLGVGKEKSLEEVNRVKRRQKKLLKELDASIKKSRTKAGGGMGSGEYEFRPENEKEADSDGDITMGGLLDSDTDGSGAEGSTPQGRDPRSVYEVCKKLDADMRELLERGAKELHDYERHADNVLRETKQGFERVKARSASVTSGQPPPGTLKSGNRVLQNLGDGDIRRLSTGMPVVSEGKNVRISGSIESMARRDI